MSARALLLKLLHAPVAMSTYVPQTSNSLSRHWQGHRHGLRLCLFLVLDDTYLLRPISLYTKNLPKIA